MGRPKQRLFRYPFVKRAADIVGSLVGLVALSPAMLVVSVVALMAQGPPIFFLQERPGLDEKIFRIIKFRTMTVPPQPGGTHDAEAVTKFGQVLRRFSIDELPQLINILRGEMSFVGPRPLLREYLPLYSAREAMRHSVRPGLTGLAQVSGRNQLSWKQKLELDTRYVTSLSASQDVRILFRSVAVAFSGDGVELERR